MNFTSKDKSVEELFLEIVDNQSKWNEENEEGCLFPFEISDIFNGTVKYVTHVTIDGRNCLMWLIKKEGFEGADRVGFLTSATTQYVNYHVIIEDLLTANAGCVIRQYLFNKIRQEVLREAFETVENKVAE